MFQGVQEGARHVAHVDVVTLEVALEQDDEPIRDRTVGEIVDQQVQAHAWADAKGCRQPKRHGAACGQQVLLQFDLQLTVERDGAQGGFFSTQHAILAHAVAAVGGGREDHLVGPAQVRQHLNGVQVDRARLVRAPFAQGRTHEAGQRDQDIGRLDKFADQAAIAHVSAHDGEAFIVAAIEERGLAVEEVVHHRDVMSLAE